MKNSDKPNKTLLICDMVSSMSKQLVHIFESKGYECICLNAITKEEVEIGAGFVDNDACASALALVGQYVLHLQNHKYENIALIVPEICKECRAVSMAGILRTSLKRAGLYNNCELIEINNAELASLSCNIEDSCKSDATCEGMRIGLCGNSAIMTSKLFYEVVYDRIEKSGCKPVLVPLQKVINEQDFLTPSVEYFEKLGIDTVIGIAPFGCLNGHAYARGQMRELLKDYPKMQVYILDYDPGASDVNMINRTELVIQSVLNK